MTTPTGPGTSQSLNSLEAQQLRQGMGTTGVLGMPTTADKYVYLGKDYERNVGVPQSLLKPGQFASDGMVPVDQANNLVWQFTDSQKKQFDDLIEKGYGKRPNSFEQRMYWWEKMVGYTGSYSSQTGQNKSVFEVAEIWANQSKPISSGGRGGGPSTTIYRDENVNLTNPSTARSVLDNALGGYLGRTPTQKEYNSFISALNMAEEAEPNISERVVRSSGGTNQTVQSKGKTSGGVSAQQFATEYAKSDEDYAETRLSTTGLQAFLGMLK
jgi:hypothetical protein